MTWGRSGHFSGRPRLGRPTPLGTSRAQAREARPLSGPWATCVFPRRPTTGLDGCCRFVHETTTDAAGADDGRVSCYGLRSPSNSRRLSPAGSRSYSNRLPPIRTSMQTGSMQSQASLIKSSKSGCTCTQSKQVIAIYQDHSGMHMGTNIRHRKRTNPIHAYFISTACTLNHQRRGEKMPLRNYTYGTALTEEGSVKWPENYIIRVRDVT